MSFTLVNSTAYVAQFVLKRGDLIVTRLAGIAPGGRVIVPVENQYQVTASTVIDDNTYITAPTSFSGAAAFLAEVLQLASQGTYEFTMVQSPSTAPDQLQFQKTCISPVTFSVSRDGKPLQEVVVQNSFEMVSLNIGDTYNVYAVINGVTTDTLATSNQNATISAVADDSSLESGYFTLVIS